MKRILLLILSIVILSSTATAQVSHYYEIDLRYDSGDISHTDVKVKPVLDEKDLRNIEGGYIAEVVSFDDEVLNLTFFDFPLTIIYDNFDEETGEAIGGGIIELNETELMIKVPYFDNAKEINIFDINIEKKLTIDVSDYAKSTVSKAEIEAPKKQQIVEQQKPEIDAETERNLSLYLWILLFLIIISMVYLYKKQHKNQ